MELVTIPGGKLLNGFVKTPTLVGDMHHDFRLTAVVGSCQAAKRDQAVTLFWMQAAAVPVRSGGLGRDLEAGTEVGCNFVKFARELTHRFMMNFFDSEIKEILLNQGNPGSGINVVLNRSFEISEKQNNSPLPALKISA